MHFETAVGPMALVMVGALIVASIETVFDAPRSPYREARDRPRTIVDLPAAKKSADFCSARPSSSWCRATSFIPNDRLAVGSSRANGRIARHAHARVSPNGITASIRAAPSFSINNRSKPSATPAQRWQTVAHRREQTLIRRRCIATGACAGSSESCAMRRAQHIGIDELVVTVRNFDAVDDQLEAFARRYAPSASVTTRASAAWSAG